MIQTRSQDSRIHVVSPYSTSTACQVEQRDSGPAPADAVSISANDNDTPEPTRAAGGKWQMLGSVARAVAVSAGLIGACAVLAGCGQSLAPEQLGPPVAQQTVQMDRQQALRFEIVPHSVRVDVIRQTHEEVHCDTDKDGNRHCTTTTENDPYQPVGVYLGRGLFLDAGLNLSVIPDRVFHGPLVPQDFHRAVIQGPFGSWSKSVMTQDGPRVGISESLHLFDNEIVRDGPDRTTMKFGTFKSLQEFNNIVITHNGDDTTVQAWAPNVALLQKMQQIGIHEAGDTVTVHPFGIKKFVDTNITYNGRNVTVQPFGGRLTRTEISKGPGAAGQGTDELIRVDHWGVGHETTERGQTGLNETSTALGLSARGNVSIQGNHYDIREPGLFGHSQITVEP